MQLNTLQKAMGTLLLETEGLGALSHEKNWAKFLKSKEGGVFQGIPRERLALYEELVYLGVEDTLRTFFPYTFKFIEPDWPHLVEQYRRAYPNRSFQLHLCAESFHTFIAQQTKWVKKYPFLPDLALYEWLEIVVFNAPNETLPLAFERGVPESLEAFSAWSPAWNATTELHTYAYNIPQLIAYIDEHEETFKPEHFKTEPHPTEILIYRDPESFLARFFILNPLTSLFIQQIEAGRSYGEIFSQLKAKESSLSSITEETLLSEGLKLVHHCFNEGLILGSIPIMV